MTRLTIEPLRTRRDRNAFLRLPWRIYAHDPHWVPPLLIERKEFIDRKRHPFFKHGLAEFFLARRDDEVVGRCCVSEDPLYNMQWKESVACFGLFECIDDSDVARALIDRASEWARTRDNDTLRGPIDYSTNYPIGLLIDGFDTPPFVMMNHQPRYYRALLEDACGMVKAKDLYAWYVDEWHGENISRVQEHVERVLANLSVETRCISAATFAEDTQLFKQVYNEAWEANWGFVKLTDAELDALCLVLKRFAQPELVRFALADGKPVGMIVAIPDLNSAIAPLNGRLTTCGLPIGLLKLWRNIRGLRTARLITLGVVPGYRKRGIGEILTLEVFREALKLDYRAAELSWTLEDNRSVNRLARIIGATLHKTYRIYEKSIG